MSLRVVTRVLRSALRCACALAIPCAPGCKCGGTTTPPPLAADASIESSQPDAAPARPVVLDFVRQIDACALGHRGVLVDFGDAATRAQLHPGAMARQGDEIVEREGATWLRARTRAVSASFYWPPDASDAPDASAYVEVRVRGVTARGISVLLDGKPFGGGALARAETRIVLARPPTPAGMIAGGHEIELRFVGGPRAPDDAYAEVDWVHVGTGDASEPYSAPTRADALTDAAIAGTSMRALSLRAPGFVRCTGWIPANATLETSLATAGGGEAEVEARLLRDRKPPVVLGTAHAGGAGAWMPWSVPITGLDGEGALASLQLVVRRATKGTRVLLGEPRAIIAGSPPVAATESARGVVVVILGSTPARALAPWGGSHAAPQLARVASNGTTFLANRASSTLANSVVASMLTGLPARAHGLDDPDARLPKAPTTIEDACRQGGVATAMFTADPTTGVAFGFDRGWDTFVAHDPLDDAPATRVLDDAAAWIDAHKGERFLVVVHARGAHPPWDASPEDLKTMPPEGYFGVIEPRRAAEALAKAHKHAGRFKEEDRVRAWALRDHAIDAHDAALGRLLDAIRAAGRESDTTVVVAGDVAPSESPPVPFIDADGLEEPLLATPLVVRWPRAERLAGRRVDAPAGPVDIARTVLGALGLSPPAAFEGVDLLRVADGAIAPAQRPMAATRGDRALVRWGSLVLVGARDREVRMCDLSLDAACVADVRATSPLSLEPLRRWTLDTLGSPTARPTRDPATPDPRTSSALVRWGRVTDAREEER